ncbi:hypothetical protein WJX74_000790 [Apatococcus lobatus]|uniref:Uncharacterized protein n=1 Tax=Apatococcus lobatus TaxID=904363 RepID=A0AAW1QKN9_9CHLO
MPGDSKNRGELGEIRSQLASLSSHPSGNRIDAANAKKELFKKIINYTTANPDLTLLTINLLTKDCRDQDPTIRGLALRSLCSLRVANLIEYLVSPIQMGLKDAHPYVRRTAVMGVLKVYNMDEDFVQNSGMIEQLQELLLQDQDSQVISNCMSVLEQVGAVKELLGRQFVIPLLNRIKDFSEWGQCQVLELASHHRPSGEQEVYDLMNILDDRLCHSNSAVAMATIKVFLHLTLSMPATHQQVLERVKDPLQTLVSRDHFETAYAVLAHFLLIAQRAPILFSGIYSSFFCRVNEPSYIKHIKLDILTAVADETNAYDIATELTEYVNDIDEQLARAAVRAVGRISLEVHEVGGIVERLLEFLEIGKSHVTAETIIQMKDLLRTFPDIAEVCLASIASANVQDVDEPEARAAFVWILGEHGQSIQDAPYLLEPLAASFASEEVSVRIALLSAASKLFFQRPPECQQLLGAVLTAAAADSNIDIHDRALLYYRLLQHNLDEARRIIQPPLPHIATFAEEQSAEMRDIIFDNFNTLAVLFRAPPSSFLQASSLEEEEDEVRLPPLGAAGVPSAGGVGGAAAVSAGVAVDEGSSLLADHDNDDAASEAVGPSANGNTTASRQGSSGPSQDVLDLLGMDALSTNGPVAAPGSHPPPAPSLRLVSSPQLNPAEFQRLWGVLQPLPAVQASLSSQALSVIEAEQHQRFLRHMAAASIATMASGGAPPLFKFYFFCQAAHTHARVLIEAIVNKTTSLASMTFKWRQETSMDAAIDERLPRPEAGRRVGACPLCHRLPALPRQRQQPCTNAVSGRSRAGQAVQAAVATAEEDLMQYEGRENWYAAKFSADDAPDWNPAKFVRAEQLAPGLRNVVLRCEISRERVPLRNAYKHANQQASVRVNGGVESSLTAASPPWPESMNKEPLYKARGDIYAGETKTRVEVTSVEAELELLVGEKEAPEVYNADESALIELGPFKGTGLNLRGPIQGIFQYPVIIIFAEGRGIAAARSFIESSADVGGLNFAYRKDVRLYYRAPNQQSFCYTDSFDSWENAHQCKVTTSTRGTFQDMFDDDDTLMYEPESTAAIIFTGGDEEAEEAALEACKEAEITCIVKDSQQQPPTQYLKKGGTKEDREEDIVELQV